MCCWPGVFHMQEEALTVDQQQLQVVLAAVAQQDYCWVIAACLAASPDLHQWLSCRWST